MVLGTGILGFFAGLLGFLAGGFRLVVGSHGLLTVGLGLMTGASAASRANRSFSANSEA